MESLKSKCLDDFRYKYAILKWIKMELGEIKYFSNLPQTWKRNGFFSEKWTGNACPTI